LGICYKFPSEEVELNDEWMLHFPSNCKDILKSWWKTRKYLRERRIGTYPTTFIRNPYNITISLLSRLYGEEDENQFESHG
jgi:hypothetical protein